MESEPVDCGESGVKQVIADREITSTNRRYDASIPGWGAFPGL